MIGWLFLLQVIAAFGLALAVLAIPSRLVTTGRLAAAAGARFAVATLGGYLLSVWTGPFGFTEVRTGAGIAAGRAERALMTAVHNALRRDLDQLPHTTASPVSARARWGTLRSQLRFHLAAEHAAATGLLLPGPLDCRIGHPAQRGGRRWISGR